jgi:hypothetical protein
MLRGERKPYAIWLNDIKQCSFVMPKNIVYPGTPTPPATNFICGEQTLFAAVFRRADGAAQALPAAFTGAAPLRCTHRNSSEWDARRWIAPETIEAGD